MQVELVDHPSLDLSVSLDAKSKRGRPAGSTATFYYWSRVLSLNHRPIDTSTKFNIDEDFTEEKQRWEDEQMDEDGIAEPLFNP